MNKGAEASGDQNLYHFDEILRHIVLPGRKQ